MTSQAATEALGVLIIKTLNAAGDRNDLDGVKASLLAAEAFRTGHQAEAAAHIKPFLFQYVEEATR